MQPSPLLALVVPIGVDKIAFYRSSLPVVVGKRRTW
jgi:hypothetical protein